MKKESLDQILNMQKTLKLNKKTVDQFIHMQEVMERIDFKETVSEGRERRKNLLTSFMHNDYTFATEGYALYFYDEAQWCFINGEFIACILMCQLVCSEMLKAHYRWTGKIDFVNKAGFDQLIKQALSDGFINHEIADKLHSMKRFRNSLEHTKDYNYDDEQVLLGFKIRYESEELATEYMKLTILLFESHCFCSWQSKTRRNKFFLINHH